MVSMGALQTPKEGSMTKVLKEGLYTIYSQVWSYTLVFGFPVQPGRGSPFSSISLFVMKKEPALKMTSQPRILENGRRRAASTLAR